VGRIHKGKRISDEHKQRIAEGTKRRWAEWRASGKSVSEETCAKISASRKGQRLTEEHKAKISTTTKGRPKSEEHKAKIAAALRNRKAY
jgi:hypothetical protein